MCPARGVPIMDRARRGVGAHDARGSRGSTSRLAVIVPAVSAMRQDGEGGGEVRVAFLELHAKSSAAGRSLSTLILPFFRFPTKFIVFPNPTLSILGCNPNCLSSLILEFLYSPHLRHLQGNVAVKRLLFSTPRDKEMFDHEVKIHDLLKHENIVLMQGKAAVGDGQAMVLQYMVHGSLYAPRAREGCGGATVILVVQLD